MKIVHCSNNQLCNRIWSIAGMIAHSLVFKEKIVIVNFKRYAYLFPNLGKNPYVYIPPHFIDKLLSLILNFLFKTKYKTAYICNKKTTGLCFINGWNYRHEYENLDIVFDEICFLFSPPSESANKCKQMLVEESHLIFGIHFRRGDYRTYKNGIYYYDDNAMRQLMKQISSLFTDKKLKFFIASNEPVKLSVFSNFDCFTNENASPIEDLFSLSLCDYIIGPPSSFSMWASFYGKKPLRILDFKDEIINLDEFDVIRAEDIFMSGRKWTSKV